MQVREATMDDLGHANAICDASERTRWTNEMIALIPLGMGYEANMPPTALDVIEAWGGNMVILTHGEVPSGVTSSPPTFKTFMSNGDCTTTWLPLS